jgi:hypothetical protein
MYILLSSLYRTEVRWSDRPKRWQVVVVEWRCQLGNGGNRETAMRWCRWTVVVWGRRGKMAAATGWMDGVLNSFLLYEAEPCSNLEEFRTWEFMGERLVFFSRHFLFFSLSVSCHKMTPFLVIFFFCPFLVIKFRHFLSFFSAHILYFLRTTCTTWAVCFCTTCEFDTEALPQKASYIAIWLAFSIPKTTFLFVH